MKELICAISDCNEIVNEGRQVCEKCHRGPVIRPFRRCKDCNEYLDDTENTGGQVRCFKCVNKINIKLDRLGNEPMLIGKEMINHPDHYGTGPYEVIKIQRHFEKDLSYDLLASLKYVFRCNKKGKKIEDLGKAIWHLTYELEMEKKK